MTIQDIIKEFDEKFPLLQFDITKRDSVKSFLLTSYEGLLKSLAEEIEKSLIKKADADSPAGWANYGLDKALSIIHNYYEK